MNEYILMWKVNIKNKENINEGMKEIREMLKAENIEFKEKFVEEWTGNYRTRHYEPSIGIYIDKKDQKKAEELIKNLQNTENIIESHTELEETKKDNELEEDYELKKSIDNRKKARRIFILCTYLSIIVIAILAIIISNINN